MTRSETSHRTAEPRVSPARPVEQKLGQAAAWLSKPILLGMLAFLSLVGSCETYGNSVSPSYQQVRYGDAAAPAPPAQLDATSTAESDAVPLLFLSFVGLAGLALSKTGPSERDRP